MTIEDEAMAAFRATDDLNQREMLKILKVTALRAPRRQAAKLTLVFTRRGGDDFFNLAGGIKNNSTAVRAGRPKITDKS